MALSESWVYINTHASHAEWRDKVKSKMNLTTDENFFADIYAQWNGANPNGYGYNFYVVVLWIKHPIQIGSNGNPHVTCPPANQIICGDGTCDNECGNENSTCTDCSPANKLKLWLKDLKIHTDYKDKHVTPKYNYWEAFFSGKYEIMAQAMIVQSNGTTIENRLGDTFTNVLGNGCKDVFKRSEVERCRKNNGV